MSSENPMRLCYSELWFLALLQMSCVTLIKLLNTLEMGYSV